MSEWMDGIRRDCILYRWDAQPHSAGVGVDRRQPGISAAPYAVARPGRIR